MPCDSSANVFANADQRKRRNKMFSIFRVSLAIQFTKSTYLLPNVNLPIMKMNQSVRTLLVPHEN